MFPGAPRRSWMSTPLERCETKRLLLQRWKAMTGWPSALTSCMPSLVGCQPVGLVARTSPQVAGALTVWLAPSVRVQSAWPLNSIVQAPAASAGFKGTPASLSSAAAREAPASRVATARPAAILKALMAFSHCVGGRTPVWAAKLRSACGLVQRAIVLGRLPAALPFAARGHVQALDQAGEGHGGVDVALRHMHPEAVGDQGRADHQQEAQRQHHHAGVAVD